MFTKQLKEVNEFCKAKNSFNCVPSTLLNKAIMVAGKKGIPLTITVTETSDYDFDGIIGYYKYYGFSVFVPIGEQRKNNKDQPYHVLTWTNW